MTHSLNPEDEDAVARESAGRGEQTQLVLRRAESGPGGHSSEVAGDAVQGGQDPERRPSC